MMKYLDLAVVGLCRLAFFFAALSLLAIAIYGTLDVLVSFGGGGGLPVTREASSALLAAGIFLSFGYSQYTKKDIRVDVLFGQFPPRLQKVSEILSIVLAIVVFGLLTWQSWENFVRSWRIGEVAMALYRFPIYPSKFALVVGSAAATLELVRQLVLFFVGRDDEADDSIGDADHGREHSDHHDTLKAMENL